MIEQLLHRPGPWRKQRAELAVRYTRARQLLTRRRPVDYLEAATERDAAWWVGLIQEMIALSFEDNPADPDHPICDPRDWAHGLVDALWDCRPNRYGDENMWLASVLSLAAGTWASRIQRAKAFDPHRPVALRQEAYRRWLYLTQALALIVADESRDPEMFDQPWESPWLPNATDGSFV